MNARNGKIARLPREIREELNQRLERSEPGPKLLAWLNGLPEVKEFIQKEFDGVPVSKQNLKGWCQSGFLDWVECRQMFAAVPLACNLVLVSKGNMKETGIETIVRKLFPSRDLRVNFCILLIFQLAAGCPPNVLLKSRTQSADKPADMDKKRMKSQPMKSEQELEKALSEAMKQPGVAMAMEVVASAEKQLRSFAPYATYVDWSKATIVTSACNTSDFS